MTPKEIIEALKEHFGDKCDLYLAKNQVLWDENLNAVKFR